MNAPMTEWEITGVLRDKYKRSRRKVRLYNLRARYKGERLDREIERTAEKLAMLYQIKGRSK